MIVERPRREARPAGAEDRLNAVTVGLVVLALATRPVGAVGVAVTVGAGLVALAPRLDLPSLERRAAWASTLALGLAGFVIARLLLAAPATPFRPWVAGASVAAGVAEEAVFRRLVYGWALRWGVLVAVIVSALLFAAVHVPGYGVDALWVDLGAGILLGWQRWASGGWAVAAATHAAANLLQLI